MGTEATRRAVYDCPHCRKELESPPDRWNGWRLCPRCGRTGLPPDRSPASGVGRGGTRPHPTPAHGVFVTSGTAKRPPRSRISVAVGPFLLVTGSWMLVLCLGRIDLDTVVRGLIALALFGLLLSVGRRN